MIILGQTKSDNINLMIATAGDFYLVGFSKWDKKININQWLH